MTKIKKSFLSVLMIAVTAMVVSSCSLTVPVAATSNPVGSKVGTSSGTCYLQILCFDADASIRTAARNGNITQISTVDIRQKNILGLIVTYETIVTGE